MKILLIDPGTPNKPFTWNLLNVGLGCLVGSLKKESHAVKVLDFSNNPDNIMGRLKIALDEKPDLVGFYVTLAAISCVKKTATEIKKKNNKIPIVAGGPHISVDGKNFLKENGVIDIGVIGEGEETIVDLCKVITGQKKLKEVKGIIYREDGEIKETPRRNFSENLDKLPFPDYSIFDTIGMDFAKTYPIITSRGCPYNCIFCCIGKTSGKKWRSRDIKEVVKEIEHAKRKLNIKKLLVFDDNFTMDMARAKEFCKLLKEGKINLPWEVLNLRADKVDYELLKNMRESGCRYVHFGIESGDPEVFKGIKKGETLEQIEKAIYSAKKVGLTAAGSFIIGLPGSTYRSEMKSLEFAKKNKLDYASFYLLRIHKGTQIWDMVEKKQGFKRYQLDGGYSFETDNYSKEQRMKANKICNVAMGRFDLIDLKHN